MQPSSLVDNCISSPEVIAAVRPLKSASVWIAVKSFKALRHCATVTVTGRVGREAVRLKPDLSGGRPNRRYG